MKILFACPVCQCPTSLDRAPTAPSWQCPRCDHRLELAVPAGDPVSHCAVCGNAELYKKKDFPHWLGLTILAVACLGFVLLNALYQQWWAWVVLIGSAAFDGLLYLWVGDAVVCYRCGAHYRGLSTYDGYKPYELVVGERYRQERLRREELKQK
ncbi:MAG: hypothetical protein K2R98_02005 [Gemmataceae bacterium]|nr:hypothetical protein [Gemmataceae bacterium]